MPRPFHNWDSPWISVFLKAPVWACQQFGLARPTVLVPYHAVVLECWDVGCVSCVYARFRILAFSGTTSSNVENLKRDSTSLFRKRPIDEDRCESTTRGLVDPRHQALFYALRVRTRNFIPRARRWRGIGLVPFMDRNRWPVFVLKLLSQLHQTEEKK